MYQHMRGPIWISAKKIYNGRNSHYKKNDGVIQGQKKRSAYGFNDLEKAYDKVTRELIWWAMKRRVFLRYTLIIVQEFIENQCNTC